MLYYATVTSEQSSHKEGLSHAGDILFRPMGGFEAGAAALLVAVKQLIPDNEVALLGGALRFRAKVCGGCGSRLARWLMAGGSRSQRSMTPIMWQGFSQPGSCTWASLCACLLTKPARPASASLRHLSAAYLAHCPCTSPPSCRLAPLPSLPIHLQHLPSLYVILMAAGSLLLGGAVRVIPFTLFGTYLGWLYLRFVQTRNGVR